MKKYSKKIMLVNPHFHGTVYAPAMGLGFIGTYLKKNVNCVIDIYDPIVKPLNRAEILDKIKEFDFLGMTCFTEARFECVDFAKDAKKLNPKLKIVIGGPHTIDLDKQMLENYPFIDYIVRHEGEETFLELIKGVNPEEIKGLTWRGKDKQVIRNEERELTKDISKYEYDYELIKDIFLWKDEEVEFTEKKSIHLPIIASRGCPYRCSYCGSFNQWKCRYRIIEPKKLVDILASLIKRYNVRYFRFYDALFMGSNDKIIEFCNELNKRRLKINFRVDLRANVNEAALAALKKAGCGVVGFGFESGSDRVLKRINKAITKDMIMNALQACKKLGFWTIGYFMISLPEETKEEMNETFNLFKHINVFNLQFFKVHPGTPFYDELKSRKIIDDKVWLDRKEGTELFHSKERFATSRYAKKEIDWLIVSAFYRFCIQNPRLIYTRHGFLKGSYFFIGSLLDYPLRGFLHKNIYERLIKTESAKENDV